MVAPVLQYTLRPVQVPTQDSRSDTGVNVVTEGATRIVKGCSSALVTDAAAASSYVLLIADWVAFYLQAAWVASLRPVAGRAGTKAIVGQPFRCFPPCQTIVPSVTVTLFIFMIALCPLALIFTLPLAMPPALHQILPSTSLAHTWLALTLHLIGSGIKHLFPWQFPPSTLQVGAIAQKAISVPMWCKYSGVRGCRGR